MARPGKEYTTTRCLEGFYNPEGAILQSSIAADAVKIIGAMVTLGVLPRTWPPLRAEAPFILQFRPFGPISRRRPRGRGVLSRHS